MPRQLFPVLAIRRRRVLNQLADYRPQLVGEGSTERMIDLGKGIEAAIGVSG